MATRLSHRTPRFLGLVSQQVWLFPVKGDYTNLKSITIVP
jgi:hypothetical protein